MKKVFLVAFLAVIALAQANAGKPKTQPVNPRGLFRLQQISYDDKTPAIKPPFEQYKYCGDSLTLQVMLPNGKNDHLSFILTNTDKKPLNFTGYQKAGEELQIYDTSDDGFTLRWYNTKMPNSDIFPYKKYSKEKYTRDSIMPALNDAFDMLKLNFNVRDNGMTGVWKRRGLARNTNDISQVYGIDTMYKIYAPDKVMVIYGIKDGKNREQAACEVTDVKYYDNRLIKEQFNGGSPCIITWIDSSTFTLTYLNHGNPVIEVWDKSGLPTSFQQLFGTNEPITTKVADEQINK